MRRLRRGNAPVGGRSPGGSAVTRQPRAIIRSFFFQAEEGMRALTVTGVQTCALPICHSLPRAEIGKSTEGLSKPLETKEQLIDAVSSRFTRLRTRLKLCGADPADSEIGGVDESV